jgi:hypothetical protein
MQVITHQFALEQFIQSASLSKYCQSLIKCDNGRKLANVGQGQNSECQGLPFLVRSRAKRNVRHIQYPEKEKYYFRYELYLQEFSGISNHKACHRQ